MNTRQLTYIVTIADKGSLSSAAADLGVSQPALSKYLTELEQELGSELFLRHNKRLILTAAGRIYVNAARQIISVKEQTYHTIDSLSREYQKTIVIGATPLRGSIAIARIFPIFQKRYPNVNLTIQEGYMLGLKQAVINHKVNMALGTCLDLDDPQILHISASQEDLILGVPIFHPLASMAGPDKEHLVTVDINDFADTPFLLGSKGSTMRALADSIFQQNHITPTVVYETNNNLVLFNMLESGAGACLLPKSGIRDSDRVVYFSLKPRYYLNLTVMFPKNHVPSAEERYLTALVLSADATHPRYNFSPNPIAKEIINEFKDTGIMNYENLAVTNPSI